MDALRKTVHLQGARRGRALDLGCGEGEVARAVFGEGEHRSRIGSGMTLWGLDNDEEMVKKARKSGVYEKVLLADAGKIPLGGEVVDLVFSNSVLEHIKDVDKVLDEVFRILKPGGRLVFTVPTKWLSEYLGWGRFYAYFFNRKYNHYHLYDLDKWKEVLNKHGFKVTKGKYYLSKDQVKHWHGLLWRGRLGLKIAQSEQAESHSLNRSPEGSVPMSDSSDERFFKCLMRDAAGLLVVARKEVV